MRVALISPYALSAYGGVQEQILSMSRELSRRGHEVLIVAPDSRDHATYDTPARVERFGHLVRLPANGSRAPLTLSPLATRRSWFCVDQFKPDVVHFHEPFAPMIGWGSLRTHRAASVATFHRSGGGPALTLTKPLLRAFAKDVDVAAAVSASSASTIEAACGLRPVVLYNGFEVERYAALPRERAGETVLVVLGRLEARKGVAVAVSAVRAHNAASTSQWRLVVVGDGPERSTLEALAAHDEMITFTGAVDDATKLAWLRRANVVVAPALRGESFGLVLLEAMAAESSVVASDIDGYRDAASGHATLFRAGDEDDLERALALALASETDATIAAAREHARRWSMSSLVEEYEGLYASAREAFDAAR